MILEDVFSRKSTRYSPILNLQNVEQNHVGEYLSFKEKKHFHLQKSDGEFIFAISRSGNGRVKRLLLPLFMLQINETNLHRERKQVAQVGNTQGIDWHDRYRKMCFVLDASFIFGKTKLNLCCGILVLASVEYCFTRPILFHRSIHSSIDNLCSSIVFMELRQKGKCECKKCFTFVLSS